MTISLNLLPPEKKRALHAAFALVSASRMLSMLCLVVIFCAATLAGVRMMLAQTRAATVTSAAATESKETTEFAQRTKTINSYLKRIDGVLTKGVSWSAMLRTLAEAAPAGVQYTNIRLDQPDLVHISGVAATRADVLQLKAALEASPSFSAIKAPLSNILTQRNVVFDFDMKFTPSAN